MVKSIKQHFDQVDRVLAKMKGASNVMSLQQLFQLSLPHKMFSVKGSQGILLSTLFMQSILNGLMLNTSDRCHCNNLNPLLVSDNSIVKCTILMLYSADDSTKTSEDAENTFEDINVDM